MRMKRTTIVSMCGPLLCVWWGCGVVWGGWGGVVCGVVGGGRGWIKEEGVDEAERESSVVDRDG